MGNTRVSWIIHIFALLHAAVALTCRTVGVEDELFLTILTMTMTLLICMKKGFNIEFTAASIIIVNIIGYLLGNAGASLFSYILDSQSAIHALATALTTETLGWSIVAFTRLMPAGTVSDDHRRQYLNWVILAASLVFLLRIGIILLLSYDIFAPGDMLEATAKVLSNSLSLITMLCINIIYIRYAGRFSKTLSPIVKVLVLTGFIAVTATVGAGLASIGIPFRLTIDSGIEFIHLYLVSLITEISIYCLTFMVNYTITAGNRMREEKEKKHVAQFRYQKLKRQVNPHFLFNSLNALDCLVCEEKTESASTYIHKLASVYRYMIRSEEEELVSLRDELMFVNMYIDLLKVRFPEGFSVRIDVEENNQARFVLPCSIQLLIENATKHNAVCVENPLQIKVESYGDIVRVSNNVIPKVTQTPSTGLGQKYIRQQYLDLSGKSILIEKTEEEYSVTLPLL